MLHPNSVESGVKTHLSMPDRHIRCAEIGDAFNFGVDANNNPRLRVVKEIKRTRGGKIMTFEDGYSIDVTSDRYDETFVDITRAKRKLQGMGVMMQDRSHAR